MLAQCTRWSPRLDDRDRESWLVRLSIHSLQIEQCFLGNSVGDIGLGAQMMHGLCKLKRTDALQVTQQFYSQFYSDNASAGWPCPGRWS